MEFKKVTEEMVQQLKKPLPEAAISQHPTKTYLSSIKAIYVTERLNEVFGVGSWSVKPEIVDKNDKGMVVVLVHFRIPEYNIEYFCYGGNDNGGDTNKNFDLGDAYKGAVTDAITKIGSWMYIGIDVFKGKKQEHSPKQAENAKQWLNEGTTQWADAVEYLKSGGTIEKIKVKYSISTKNQELLISQAI